MDDTADRFHFLAEKSLHNALTPAERNEFRAMLEQSAEQRQGFLQIIGAHNAMREILGQPASESGRREASVVLNRMKAEREQSRKGSRTVRRSINKGGGWGVWFSLAAVACIAIVATVWLTQRRDGKSNEPLTLARLSSGTRNAVVVRGTARIDGAAGTTLFAGDRVSVGADGSAAIQFGDLADILLGKETDIQLPKLPEGTPSAEKLTIDRGNAKFSVRPQPPGQPFIVATPHGKTTVIGTEFALDVAVAQTRLDVSHGRVRLTRMDGQSVEVSAGEFAVAGSGVEFAARSTKAVAPETKPANTDNGWFETIKARGATPIAALTPLKEGTTIRLNDLPASGVTFIAHFPADVVPAEVVLELDGRQEAPQKTAPYALTSSDAGTNFAAAKLTPGTHTLKATPFKRKGATMVPGTPLIVQFHVVKDAR